MNTTDKQQNASIFLNYRREDSMDVTTRLHEDLVSVLGENVFIDMGTPSGTEWPQYLRDQVNAATIVIVVIGKDWLLASDPESHQRRLDAENDWVRNEIDEALRGQKVVIPVLVRGAGRPLPQHLPASIRELATRQTFTISAESWKSDVEKLLKDLMRYGMQPKGELENRPMRSEPSFLGVIEYFYRKIGEAASGEHTPARPSGRVVHFTGLSNLWASIEDLIFLQNNAPFIQVKGQLSPYAPLLCGNPAYKRRLHLGLRQGIAKLIPEQVGYEFSELLNGFYRTLPGRW
jgi:hypothetical protein